MIRCIYAPASGAHISAAQVDWKAAMLCPTDIVVPSGAAVRALPLAVAHAIFRVQGECLIARQSLWKLANRKPKVSLVVDSRQLGDKGLSAAQIDNWFAVMMRLFALTGDSDGDPKAQTVLSGVVCDAEALDQLEFGHHSQLKIEKR